MPSSSAPVDPGKLGHPVALTRGAGDGPASQSANGSTVQTSRGVSFASEDETRSSEESVQHEATSIAGGSTSAFDFAQGVSSSAEETRASEGSTQKNATSTAGGLFSVPDFASATEAKAEEVFSPTETSPGPTTDSSVQKPST
jgi:hypothetical protein